MRIFLDNFIYPFWMELLGLCFLMLSIFVDWQVFVNLGFALLIAGAIVNGVSHIAQQIRDWRNQKRP